MSEPKRMSDAELASALAEFAVLANHYAKQHAHLPLAISRHIDAINIELTRRALTAEPSRVEDTEVEMAALTLLRIATHAELVSEIDSLDRENIAEAAAMLRRLAAAKASAERDRDYLKNWRTEAEGAIIKATTAAVHATERAETAEAKLAASSPRPPIGDV